MNEMYCSQEKWFLQISKCYMLVRPLPGINPKDFISNEVMLIYYNGRTSSSFWAVLWFITSHSFHLSGMRGFDLLPTVFVISWSWKWERLTVVGAARSTGATEMSLCCYIQGWLRFSSVTGCFKYWGRNKEVIAESTAFYQESSEFTLMILHGSHYILAELFNPIKLPPVQASLYTYHTAIVQRYIKVYWILF